MMEEDNAQTRLESQSTNPIGQIDIKEEEPSFKRKSVLCLNHVRTLSNPNNNSEPQVSLLPSVCTGCATMDGSAAAAAVVHHVPHLIRVEQKWQT